LQCGLPLIETAHFVAAEEIALFCETWTQNGESPGVQRRAEMMAFEGVGCWSLSRCWPRPVTYLTRGRDRRRLGQTEGGDDRAGAFLNSRQRRAIKLWQLHLFAVLCHKKNSVMPVRRYLES